MSKQDRIGLATALALAIAAVAISVASAVPYTNVRVNVHANYPEETSIAINPHNPDNVLGVAQGAGCYTYPTFDGGSTWTEGALPDQYALGDPSVIFDREGSAFYCFIGDWQHSGIYVSRSSDGGVTWKPTATAVIAHQGQVPFEDKPYPIADWTGGPRAGYIYVTWTQFTRYGSSDPADSSRILFSRSDDHGETFSTPVPVSDRGGDAIDSDNTVEGAVPAVGPNGTIYVAWAGPRGIEFDRSTNGGVSWGRDQVISDMPGGWDFNVPGIYRTNGLPIVKVDLSYGHYRGRIYVNWSDQRNGDTDIFLVYSDDGGATWSPRILVNDDPVGNGKDQFFSWMDVDVVTGTVYVDFYDRREHADDLTTDVYLAYSEDGGAHFANAKISATPFVPRNSVFFGDYTGISAFGGRVRPLWMRLDGTTLSLWTALIDRPTAAVIAGSGAAGLGRLAVHPNPVQGGGAEILYSAPTAGIEGTVQFKIHDAAGRLVRMLQAQKGQRILWDGRSDTGNEVPAGVYFISGHGFEPARIVVIR